MANILVFGDSIGQGYYDKEGGWVDKLKRHFLQEEIKNAWKQSVNVFNLCLSGDTTAEVLARIEKETPQRIWDDHEVILVFEIGLNDAVLINGKAKVSIERFQENLKSILDLSYKYSNKIIFLGLTPVVEEKVTPMPWSTTESWNNNRIRKYNELVKKLCNENKVAYLELFNLFYKKDYKSLLCDGAHPNTKGHKIIFETVKIFLVNKYLNG